MCTTSRVGVLYMLQGVCKGSSPSIACKTPDVPGVPDGINPRGHAGTEGGIVACQSIPVYISWLSGLSVLSYHDYHGVLHLSIGTLV